MDEQLAAAITSVSLPAGTARQWFDLVTGVYSELRDSGAGADFALFRQRFTAACVAEFLAPELPQRFLDHLARNGGMPLLARLCALGSGLAQRYELILDERRKNAANTDDEPAAQSSWQRLVGKHGPDWSGWDGSDTGWVRYRDWFYTVSNMFDRQVYAEAYQRLDPLNTLGTEDRIAALRELGFTITATAPTPVEPVPAERPGMGRRLLNGLRRTTPKQSPAE